MRPSSEFKFSKSLRWTTVILGLGNLVTIFLAAILLYISRQACRGRDLFPVTLVLIVAFLRLLCMVRAGVVQYATAFAMIGDSHDVDDVDSTNASRLYKKMQYTKWALWTRISTIIVFVQFLLAVFVICTIAKTISHNEESHNHCVLGSIGKHATWKKDVLVSFVVLVTFVAMLQCFSNSDVLRWRVFYSTNDNVWKAHYQEEDEVHSVAKLLGDLVTYRASGTGHMELLTGLALLQTKNQLPEVEEGFVDAPEEVLQQAMAFHPFAEAAYTGPLLDVGRNVILFPCVWLYRQGILNAVWSRNSRPVLEGDNWWRGHAAAFLNYANVSPIDLRRGRVNQTPEDLITDGLCKESPFTPQDLDGLINGNIEYEVRQRVNSSFPHYGHSGIIEAARELFKQFDGIKEGDEIESQPGGFLSSLLEDGCECEGYVVRLVGHSLGGAIASVLAIMLYGRYPNLHVYAFGPLPCVDLVIAEACSSFTTSIIHDSEFSSCLSVNSVLRLRATALRAVAQDKTSDESITDRLASLFINVSKFHGKKMGWLQPTPKVEKSSMKCDVDENNSTQSGDDVEGKFELEQGAFLRESRLSERNDTSSNDSSIDSTATTESTTVDPVTRFMRRVPSSSGGKAVGNPPELYLPGKVVHLLRQQRTVKMPLWKGWRVQERTPRYRAIIANRENFKDITVSMLPSNERSFTVQKQKRPLISGEY
ncbi:hypothetical protein V2J09_012387 [Rumex salicifolius]